MSKAIRVRLSTERLDGVNALVAHGAEEDAYADASARRSIAQEPW